LRQTILLECVTRSAHATHLATLLHIPDWRSRFTPTLAAGSANSMISPKWEELDQKWHRVYSTSENSVWIAGRSREPAPHGYALERVAFSWPRR
jgi:hypothetical protein